MPRVFESIAIRELVCTEKYVEPGLESRVQHAKCPNKLSCCYIFELMGIELLVPDHSTLSRRMAKLSIELPVIPKAGARHVVVDSAEVKIYGEGEWKTRQTVLTNSRVAILHSVINTVYNLSQEEFTVL